MNKIAIVGIGAWGKKLLAEFSKYTKVEMAVGNGDLTNKLWLSNNFPKVNYTEQIDEIINNRDIAATVIATPIETHFNIAKLCLARGKHVFLEKPPCFTYEEGLTLLKLAKEKNCVLFVDNIYAFDKAFIKLKNLVSKTLPRKTIFNWEKYGSFNSNILWNLAYHEIFLALELFSKPQEVKIGSITINIVNLELTYEKHKVYININRNYLGKPSKTITVFNEQSLYILSKSTIYEGENNKRTLYRNKESLLSLVVRKFIKEIDTKTKKYSNMSTSLEAVGIIEKLSTNK